MSFVTPAYLVFFLLVFSLYWGICRNSVSRQNVLLLIASCFFYGCWDYRFLLLLAFSTLVNYFGAALLLSSSRSTRRLKLVLLVGINLLVLGYFKYFNFFVSSFISLVNGSPSHSAFTTFHIILPVGISFYTFHGLSYILDVYYERIKPENDLVTYSLFVAYFPLLVAGPIERATHLLPQLKAARIFSSVEGRDGLRQLLWGLFKKIVVADNCAALLDPVFASPSTHSSYSLVMAALLFSVQIYADFSGYSDIALGCSRLLGIELLRNFAYPYFSRDIAEFWRRWHISLTTWFRDYVYIPLGGN
jgi:D-alanyl-lipoteichoic acid acyltransferase DltB (MBOAT superfamily)